MEISGPTTEAALAIYALSAPYAFTVAFPGRPWRQQVFATCYDQVDPATRHEARDPMTWRVEAGLDCHVEEPISS